MQNLRKDYIDGTFLDNVTNPPFGPSDVSIFGCAFDSTASYKKGTSLGPYAIMDASHQIEYYPPFCRQKLSDIIKIHFAGILEYPQADPFDEKQIEQLTHMVVTDTKTLALQSLQKTKPFILLGGEHSVTNGPLEAIASIHNPKDVTILSIDAHLDMRKDFEGFHYSHGSIMHNAVEHGFNVVLVGIRDHISAKQEGGEADFIDAKKLWGNIFFCATQPQDYYRKFSAKKPGNMIFGSTISTAQMKRILSKINTKYLYITIDVDGFDPAHFPGTGTPLPHGLSIATVESLLYSVLTSHRQQLLGLDVVEVSPMLKSGSTYSIQNTISTQTEMNAALLLYKLLLWQYLGRLK